MNNDQDFANEDVANVFANFPEQERENLLKIRSTIFRVAKQTPGVGKIQEMLKWGQPAYLTPQTKSGSTIRLGIPAHGGFAIYVHCQTSILRPLRECLILLLFQTTDVSSDLHSKFEAQVWC